MKEDNEVRRIFLLNPDQRLLREAARTGVQVRSAEADPLDERALRPVLDEAAAAGLFVNPARSLRVLADPDAVRRLVRDNRLSPDAAGPATGGTRLSVETLSVHGMHQTVGITARMPYGLLYPAPLTEDTAAEVRAVVTALLDLTGYQYGSAHERRADRARAGDHRLPCGTGQGPGAGAAEGHAAGSIWRPGPCRCWPGGWWTRSGRAGTRRRPC